MNNDKEDGEVTEKKSSIDSNQSIKRLAEDEEQNSNKRKKIDKWIYSINDNGEDDKDEIVTKNKIEDDEQSLDEGEIIDDDDDDANYNNKDKNINDEIVSNYSDWSDGEDDLLKADTQQEIKNESVNNKNNDELNNKDDNDDLEAISDDEIDDISSNDNVEKLLQKNYDTLIDNDDDNDIDDDDELEEINIIDTLKIDWKSLIYNENNLNDNNNDDNKQINKDDINFNDNNNNNNIDENMKQLRSEKFRQKNSTLTMLNRIGFSEKFAGQELTEKINNYLSEKLKDKYQPMLHKIPVLHSFYFMKNKKLKKQKI